MYQSNVALEEVREILLSEPQFQLVTSSAKYPAFVGGFGSGKTEALINRTLKLKFQYNTCNNAYYLPTYDLVRMIAFPRFEEKLEDMKMFSNAVSYKSVKSPRPSILIRLYDEPAGEIIFRTMDNPSLIVGYEVADSEIDELDVMSRDNAEAAWRKIIARNRQKKPDGKKNTVAVGTTPEGFKYVYERWGKDIPKSEEKGFKLIKASTYSNQKNLPVGYIDSLMDDYPSSLIAAYIDGEFVNLTSGSVYPEFDRTLNNCGHAIIGDEDLYVGMDFNVTKMAAVVCVNRNAWPCAVTELTGIYDTPAMIKALKARFPNNRIFIYPDASGNARKSQNASTSDISALKQAGFNVFHDFRNPLVKDRVLAVCRMIKNGNGERRFLVNIDACPMLVEGLEKQAYDKNGEPDKTSGLDHCLDALGYFISYVFPIKPKRSGKLQMVGI